MNPILAAHGLEPAVTHLGKRVDRLIIDIETGERVRALYARLASEYEAEPTVPDHGGGVPGDRFDIESRERARRDHDEDEREPYRHDRDDSQGYRDAVMDAGRGELLRG